MPLALVPAMALLEFGALVFRRDVPRGAILTLAWLCAVSAGLATASGLVLAGEDGYGSDTVGNHKLAGIVLGSLAVLAAIAACFANRTPFRVLLLLAVAATVPAGHLGGSITHGADFLFEPLTHRQKAPRPAGVGAAGQNDNGDSGGSGNATSGEPVSEYRDVIVPILDRTCSKCHNPDKQKAELLLTTPEGIMKGSENGPVLVPGKPDDSLLLTNCLLPIDDEFHMPPEGKPRPTADELEKLRAWIAAGAKFD
jgi:hypothetical protein